MQYVVIEFLADVMPCVADADWPLTTIAEKLGLDWLKLSETTGVVIGSTFVWYDGKPVAAYRELRPLLAVALPAIR